MSATHRNDTESHQWFIAHDGARIIHYGELDQRQEVTTGQDFLELFSSEQDWTARKIELGCIEEA